MIENSLSIGEMRQNYIKKQMRQEQRPQDFNQKSNPIFNQQNLQSNQLLSQENLAKSIAQQKLGELLNIQKQLAINIKDSLIVQQEIISRFKQDLYQKMEANISITIKEQLGAISRSNARQIMQIKNIATTITNLLISIDKKMVRIQLKSKQLAQLLKQ